MKKYIVISGILTFAFSLSLSLGSCRKKGDTIVKITVRDTGNYVVPGAQVILRGTSTTTPIQPVILRDTAETDPSGIAYFNFNDEYQLGQAGFAVLDIEARKNGHYGSGVIKVVEEEENTKTVFIVP
ncbi:MAG: hypothetical protein WC994_03035 [Brumimicrobium sp.]